MIKASKASVNYTDHATDKSEQCKVCEHFRQNKRPTEGTCAIVLGRINARGWCEEFKHAPADR